MKDERDIPVREPEAATERRRPGRPRSEDSGAFRPVTFYIDNGQYRRIGEMARRDRRSIKQTLYLIIEAGLKALLGDKD